MDITKILFYASIPMALISIGFFIYGNFDLTDLKDDLHSVCQSFLEYNIIHLVILLTSVVVLFFYLCCSSICASFIFLFNGFVIGGQLVEKYVKETDRCNLACQTNCSQLVDLSEKINMCLIGNGSILVIVIILLLLKFLKCLICI
tara:strand:- start:35 stop:472 length:438 start_codon:yes stop_codon:yes gene_type:complete